LPKAAIIYVKHVEAASRAVGKFAMYIVFGMMGILLFETLSRNFFSLPHIWVVEVAQFTMAAYYLLGGGYSMILEGHVRMDLLYDKWSAKRKATVDAITGCLLIFYVVFLIIGGISGIDYALTWGQKNYTPWGPPLAPIKIIMMVGIVLMLFQVIASFLKDMAVARGRAIT
jgi:TRAP-type mannitol/chloroaromatic compound transport system permease small subunit